MTMKSVKLHNFTMPTSIHEHVASPETTMDAFRIAKRIRLLEEEMTQMYKLGRIRGFCHLVIGQENIWAAMKMVISGDSLITSYRCHGAALTMGCTITEVLGEVLGFSCGNSKGKGGSMHIYGNNFYGGHGIVGAQVPLGIGISFGIKYKSLIWPKDTNVTTGPQSGSSGKENNKENLAIFCNLGASESNAFVKSVCFVIYGDGASNQGQVYESFNIAKIFRLPVVFICENNMYGMYTPVADVSVDDNFYMRGYGIPGLRTDDQCPFRLANVLEVARTHALNNGPIIVQIDTNRLCGHSTLDTEQAYKAAGTEKDLLPELMNLLRLKIGNKEADAFATQIVEETHSEMNSINKNVPEIKELFKDI